MREGSTPARLDRDSDDVLCGSLILNPLHHLRHSVSVLARKDAANERVLTRHTPTRDGVLAHSGRGAMDQVLNEIRKPGGRMGSEVETRTEDEKSTGIWGLPRTLPLQSLSE